MKKQWIILGVDVSKATLDVHCQLKNEHLRIANNQEGLASLLQWAKKSRISLMDLWIVFEHTGMYSLALAKFCSEKVIRFSEVPGMAIKRSLGIARGKNDRVDAKRICLYGTEKQLTLKVSPGHQEVTHRLKSLMNLRDRMVTQRAGYQVSAKEFMQVQHLKQSDIIIKTELDIMKMLDVKINKVEAEINAIIERNEELSKNYKLLISVKGIGFVTAVYTIVYTANFSRFDNARQFACYCGTAPFEKNSGTSIRGKTKISHLANKKMKSLLNQAAKSASQCDPELRNYYQIRLEKGKSKMSSINIIRNKLIGRMFAVVKQNRPYQIKFAA